jgi:hypothetical protein
MNIRIIRGKLQPVALVSSIICSFCGLLTTLFHLGEFFSILFWLFLGTSIISAALSLPRWKSLAALVIIGLAYVWSDGGAPYEYRSTLHSPDEKYKLVIYSRQMLMAFPGGGSDAPGYVQLQDQSGRVLDEGYLGMVQLAYEVEWGEDEVHVGPHGDGSYTWKLR